MFDSITSALFSLTVQSRSRKSRCPYTVVIGVDMPTKVRFVFGRCEKNSASGIRIRQAEVIPWIITGMLMPRPLKYPMLLNSTQVRIHSGAKPRR